MYFATQSAGHDLVARVDHIKPFVVHGAIPLLCQRFVSFRASANFTMAKIDVSKVAEILKKNQIDPALLRRVVEEMNLAAQPEAGDDDKPPAIKKQWVVMVSDPDGKMPKHDFVAWVLQIPESESVATTQDRLFR